MQVTCFMHTEYSSSVEADSLYRPLGRIYIQFLELPTPPSGARSLPTASQTLGHCLLPVFVTRNRSRATQILKIEEGQLPAYYCVLVRRMILPGLIA